MDSNSIEKQEYSNDIDNLKSKPQTKFSQFINDQGFGWIFEDEEADEESSKSILDELEIDFVGMQAKIKSVLLLGLFKSDDEHEREMMKRDPEFWGPLLIILVYSALILYGQIKVISYIFLIWFIGSFGLFFLTRALGSEVTYSVTVGVVGYAMLPLTLCVALSLLFGSFPWISVPLKLIGVIWATLSTGSHLISKQSMDRKILLLYPILLLFTYLMSLNSGV